VSDGDTGRVAVFGSLNLDLTVSVERFPRPGETLTGSELVTAPGGKSANQAAAAAVLGSAVRLVGAVGDDPNGEVLLERAGAAGVDVSGVRRDPEHATGSAMIVVDADGENTIIVSPGANGNLSPGSVPPDLCEGAAVLCLVLEVPVAAVQAAAEQARAAGVQVLLNLSPVRHVPDELLALTDVLLVNRDEAAAVLGLPELDDDWERHLAGLQECGVARTVVTLGAQGSVVLDATAAGDARVRPIEAVPVEAIDTTGCGDAFTGALAHALAGGATLVDAARLAAAASALASTRPGAQSSYAAFAHLRGRDQA